MNYAKAGRKLIITKKLNVLSPVGMEIIVIPIVKEKECGSEINDIDN